MFASIGSRLQLLRLVSGARDSLLAGRLVRRHVRRAAARALHAPEHLARRARPAQLVRSVPPLRALTFTRCAATACIRSSLTKRPATGSIVLETFIQSSCYSSFTSRFFANASPLASLSHFIRNLQYTCFASNSVSLVTASLYPFELSSNRHSI